MSLTLTGLETIIDDCIENELKIVIICDREIASIVEEYCDEYDLDELHNVICDYIPYGHKNSGYAITIECQDGEYEYYIDFHKHNTILSGSFDEIHVIGEEFINFDIETVDANKYIIYGDMIVDEDDLPITQEEHDRWVKAECGSSCVECCLDCSDYECEWNGNIEDCDCDECYEYKQSDKYKNDCCEDEECEEDECDCECHNHDITDEDIIIEYTKAILSAEGCIDCTLELVSKLAGFMKSLGYAECKEEVFEKLFGD